MKLLKSEKFKAMRAVVIYVPYKNQADQLSVSLRQQGMAAASYHAGLTHKQRDRAQSQFLRGKVRVMVATVAFGMGIDKRDIDGVIHTAMSKSVEAYVQEVGRAGRDGTRDAYCHTMLCDEDLLKFRALSQTDGVDTKTIKAILIDVFGKSNGPAPKTARVARKEPRAVQQPRANAKSVAQGGKRHEVAPNAPYTRCLSGTRKALCIDKLSLSYDLRAEQVETLLCFLEFEESKPIRALPPVYRSCEITFSRVDPSALSALNPVVSHILKHASKGKGKGKLIFSMMKVAEEAGLSTMDLECQLAMLRRNKEARVEYKDKAAQLEILQAPSLTELVPLAASLQARMQAHVDSERLKIDTLYGLLAPTSLNGHSWAPKAVDDSVGDTEIHAGVEAYFASLPEDQPEASGDAAERRIEDVIEWLGPERNKQRKVARSDVKAFLNQNPPVSSGRTVAKIFQGLASPQYTSDMWRSNQFWGRYMPMSFEEIRGMAEEELRFARGATISIEDLGKMANEDQPEEELGESSAAANPPATDEFGFEEGCDEAMLAACDEASTGMLS